MMGYEIGRWDFAVNVHNLTNKDYFATCLVRGDCWVGKERTAVARMRYKF
jgi:iron complex outermembrane receptor protein